METVVCSASGEKIQDEILGLHPEKDDLQYTSNKLPVSIPQTDISEKFNFEEKISQNMSKETAQKLNKNESDNGTDTLSSKSLSPTLIEHAFKVVKNIFSPDKNRSRPASVLTSVSQQHYASGSPRNSVLAANKSEIFSNPDIDFSSFGVSAESNLKGDALNSDQGGLSFDTPNQDSHNNTNDSFLTTVSLIEESFQSAVTHLDNGDGMNSEISLSGILSDSRNLDVLDPSNDTLCSSEYDLENTILKNGSFASMDSLINNISDNCEKNILRGVLSECLVDVEEKSHNVGEEKDCQKNVVVSESFKVSNADKNLNKNTVSLDSEQTNYKSEVNASFLGESIKITEGLKTKDSSLPKIINKSLNDSDMTLNENSLNNCSDVTVTKGNLNNVKQQNYLLPKDENVNKDSSNILDNEWEKSTDTNISTTTIVLSETVSDSSNALHAMNLPEDNENAPPNIYEIINNSSPNKLKELYSGKPIKAVNNTNNNNNNIDSEDKTIKGESKSNGNTPNKLLKGSKNKLNKSLDSVTRKNIYNSPKGKKSFRQKLVEECAVDTTKEGQEKIDYLFAGESSSGSKDYVQESNSLSSQQSYTVLNTSDTNLRRPVIHSFENLEGDSSQSVHGSPSYIITKSLKIKKTVSDLSNECNNLTGEKAHLISPKQSTPELLLNNSDALYSFSENNLPSSPVNEIIPLDKNQRMMTPDNLEFSPVIPAENEAFTFVNSVEKQTINTSSPRSTSPQKNDSFTPPKDLNRNEDVGMAVTKPFTLNQTFNVNTKTPENQNLNETFDLKPNSQESNCESETFDLKTESDTFIKLNETFNINKKYQESGKIEESFDLKKETNAANKLNETFDLILNSQSPKILVETSASKSNMATFDQVCPTLHQESDGQSTSKLNETFDKKPDSLNQTFDLKFDSQPGKKLNSTFEDKGHDKSSFFETDGEQKVYFMNVEEKKLTPEKTSIQAKPCSTTIIEPNMVKLEVMESLLENRDCLNSSFLSTNSSNTSLLCNNNFTVLLNQESSRKSVSENNLALMDIKPDLFMSAENEEWSDTFSRPPSAEKPFQNKNLSTDSKVNTINRDDKELVETDLARLIQKQFTTSDIEKICSVVDDFSVAKPPVQNSNINLVLPNDGAKNPDLDENSLKPLNPLSPHSFDFLNSIGGKPTGRDWSRESLYVKFDPLVQVPTANSLIDFTKEVESVHGIFESNSVNNTAVEHLLSISPQKKSDEIVPPLTPFSHKNRNTMKEDKTERLKELQNEIYFLKNLYSERERMNKSKLENYETQITKLIGQSCVLENNLKESSEREKSLVKKLQEQEQNIKQMKMIMEEYIKVITKLTTELEKSKSENSMKLEALTAERDSYVTHLQNTEAAFTDVHAKYEKSKKTIVNLKTNEAMFRQTLADQMQKIEEYKEKTRDAQERACKEMQRLQDELSETKAIHSQETARLKAQLRKTELKLEAMQESLDQKIKENQQLTAICDELIEGKK